MHDCRLVSGSVITETHGWGGGISSVAENKAHLFETLGSISRTNEKRIKKETHFCLTLKFMLLTLHFEAREVTQIYLRQSGYNILWGNEMDGKVYADSW